MMRFRMSGAGGPQIRGSGLGLRVGGWGRGVPLRGTVVNRRSKFVTNLSCE